VTFKEKGTGLGLAIVKKIMEDHKGNLLIGGRQKLDNPLGGALMVLELPLEVQEYSTDQAGQNAAA
jgi:two-component system nitrogen regulation sensor histidine kinase NtrY